MEKLCSELFSVALTGSVGQEPGVFEVLAITAGEGNGWKFSPQVLQQSLPLWEGTQCFVDHGRASRSVRDLAGVCKGPTWDESANGVRLTLAPGGPSGALLAQTGREWLAAAEPRPRLGFSADVLFEAKASQVQRILRVNSLDLVINPARGGEFLGEVKEKTGMQEEQEQSQRMAAESTTQVQAVQREQLAGEAASAGGVREQMCGFLLETVLAGARLPAPLTERVRKQFDGRMFEPRELTAAVEDARSLASQLSGPSMVSGLGRVSGMFSSEDQLNAAVSDLFGVERAAGQRDLQPHRLSGIRELYTLTTGDYDFHGGYHPERAQFSSSTTSLPGLLKNAFNKIIYQHWQDLGRSGYRWWEPVVDVQHFNSLQDITGVLVGEITVLPSVEEGAAYTELDVKDSAETGSWTKYGGYIGVTLEMIERDETHKLAAFPRKLASAGLRRISALVGSIFTTNSGAGPVMKDTHNVFDAVNHANLGSTALSGASWEAASQAIYSQKLAVAAGAEAPMQALDARYLLVPRGLRLTGWNILYPSFAHEANIFSENLQRGEMGDVIVCPEFSDATDWAAAADPHLAPAVVVGERFGLMPEIYIADNELNGALFSNDQIRMKARHWLSVFVVDYRPLYKANVTG